MNLSVFLCLEMIGQLSQSNLGIGKLKLGFLGGKGLNATRVVHDVRSPQRVAALASRAVQ